MCTAKISFWLPFSSLPLAPVTRDRISEAGIAKRVSQTGLSLIELIIFIAVVSAAVAGILVVLDTTTKHSVNPMITKQALAIANSLLEEVELMPFTFCDPDDPNAVTAASAADCTGGAGGANDESKSPLSPEPGESRYSATTPFDNVSDYNGFFMNSGNGGIKDISGNAIASLNGYDASIAIAQQALGAVPASDSLKITVTVNYAATNTTVVLEGYRLRYAPNITP